MVRNFALALLIGIVSPGAALAQRGGGRRGGRMGGTLGGAPGLSEQSTVFFLAALLNLSDSQERQTTAIFDSAMKAAEPLQAQLAQVKQSLFDAAKTGQDDSKIGALANQQASLSAQLLAQQARAFSKLSQILSPDQRTNLDSSMFDMVGSLLSRPPEPEPPEEPPATPPPTTPPPSGSSPAPSGPASAAPSQTGTTPNSGVSASAPAHN